jgi:hypothetical protein
METSISPCQLDPPPVHVIILPRGGVWSCVEVKCGGYIDKSQFIDKSLLKNCFFIHADFT